MFSVNRRLAPEHFFPSIVSGDRERANADDQQLLVTEFDRECGTNDGSVAPGVSVADRFDYRMLGRCERHFVPYELDLERDGGAGWPEWQPGCPGHWQETRGLPIESRSAGETGEQIDEAAVCLQKQQRYV